MSDPGPSWPSCLFVRLSIPLFVCTDLCVFLGVRPFPWFQGQVHLSRSNIKVTFFQNIAVTGALVCFKYSFFAKQFPYNYAKVNNWNIFPPKRPSLMGDFISTKKLVLVKIFTECQCIFKIQLAPHVMFLVSFNISLCFCCYCKALLLDITFNNSSDLNSFVLVILILIRINDFGAEKRFFFFEI